MRIRKRQVPFPLSSLSPVPLSDPHSPVVQLPSNHTPPLIEDDTAAYFNAPSSSDHQFQPIQLGTTNTTTSTTYQTANLLKKDEREGERSNDTRSAKMDTLVNHEQSDSLHQVGKWYEGEKAFPLKKRRRSLETKSNEETDNKKMKTKMNKKCMQQNGYDNQDGINNKESKEAMMKNNNGKKRGRGGGLMEGSRCSRVNGRGWRCCQQTLVGYSLCEHHLGKGRLRSMTSVRSRSKAAHPHPLSSSDDKQDKADQYSEEGEKDPVMSKKTKTKLGIVKARSMSSLLGQQNNN